MGRELTAPRVGRHVPRRPWLDVAGRRPLRLPRGRRLAGRRQLRNEERPQIGIRRFLQQPGVDLARRIAVAGRLVQARRTERCVDTIRPLECRGLAVGLERARRVAGALLGVRQAIAWLVSVWNSSGWRRAFRRILIRLACSGMCGRAAAYILYLKSSGDIFSRISAHLSRETLERFCSFPSSICCSTLEASSTFLAT